MLIDLAVARTAGGDHAEALRCAEEGAAIARSLGSGQGEGSAAVARAWALLGLGRESDAVDAAREGAARLEEARSGERWRAQWALGTALEAAGEVEAAGESLRRAVALLSAIRDDLPADDTARRAAVTRVRSGPARSLVVVLRALAREDEAEAVAGQWEVRSDST
jgi:hypothetical protein